MGYYGYARLQRAHAASMERRGRQHCPHCPHRNDWHQLDPTPPVFASDLATRALVEIEPARYDTISCRAEQLGEPPCPCSYPNT